MKMNLPIRGNVIRLTQGQRKRKNGDVYGIIGFFARSTSKATHYDRYTVSVNANTADDLYRTLVEVGARI